jgi:hypothetical protein
LGSFSARRYSVEIGRRREKPQAQRNGRNRCDDDEGHSYDAKHGRHENGAGALDELVVAEGDDKSVRTKSAIMGNRVTAPVQIDQRRKRFVKTGSVNPSDSRRLIESQYRNDS